jgi:hypothetical protein
MSAPTTCDQLMPIVRLVELPHAFVCQYCGTQWARGGSKEGFVKAGASRHVTGCQKVLLLEKGYVADKWIAEGQTAVPIADAQPKVVQAVKLLKRSRARSGLAPVINN